MITSSQGWVRGGMSVSSFSVITSLV